MRKFAKKIANMGQNLTLSLQKKRLSWKSTPTSVVTVVANISYAGRWSAEKKILAETNTFFLRPKLAPEKYISNSLKTEMSQSHLLAGGLLRRNAVVQLIDESQVAMQVSMKIGDWQ